MDRVTQPMGEIRIMIACTRCNWIASDPRVDNTPCYPLYFTNSQLHAFHRAYGSGFALVHLDLVHAPGAIGPRQIPQWITRHATPCISPIYDCTIHCAYALGFALVHLDQVHALGAIGPHQIPRWITCQATPCISPIPDCMLSILHMLRDLPWFTWTWCMQ